MLRSYKKDFPGVYSNMKLSSYKKKVLKRKRGLNER
jgi:hypothetical protein